MNFQDRTPIIVTTDLDEIAHMFEDVELAWRDITREHLPELDSHISVGDDPDKLLGCEKVYRNAGMDIMANNARMLAIKLNMIENLVAEGKIKAAGYALNDIHLRTKSTVIKLGLASLEDFPDYPALTHWVNKVKLHKA